MSIDPERVLATHRKLREEAEGGGYHLNPEEEWTLDLVRGLLTNEQRYGYWSCPCRLAAGSKGEDLDIVCPCDYRDPDLSDHGACFCALYVSEEVLEGKREVLPIPERRPKARPREEAKITPAGIQLWRCRVCGYLCAREHPPGVCPVCKAKRERFELFVLPAGAFPGGRVAREPESSDRETG